jgi:hypothetical protein
LWRWIKSVHANLMARFLLASGLVEDGGARR